MTSTSDCYNNIVSNNTMVIVRYSILLGRNSMQTKYYNKNSYNDDDYIEWQDVIDNGGIVAFPTETVYGLAVKYDDIDAIRRLFSLKERGEDKPLTLHVSSIDKVLPYVTVTPGFEMLAQSFLPGPLTIVLPKKNCNNSFIGNVTSVAVRMPCNDIAKAFISSCGSVVAATSANYSGSVPCINASDVKDRFDGKIDAIIDGGWCNGKISSTVISLVAPVPMILRQGGITKEAMEEVLHQQILIK